MIDPNLLARVREADPSSSASRALKALESVEPDWHRAVVAYCNFEQCNVSHAAKGIIWLQDWLDGRRPV